MGALSKFSEMAISYNCYETAHTWTPDCNKARTDLFISVFKACFPLYGGINLMTQISKRDFSAQAFLANFKSSSQSSLSIAYCLYFLLGTVCMLRHSYGYYSPTIIFASGLVGCYLGICVEDQKRVRPLTVYMLNLMTEVFLNAFRDNNIQARTPGGYPLALGVSLAVYLFLARTHRLRKDPFKHQLSFWLVCKPWSEYHGATERIIHTYICTSQYLIRFATIGAFAATGSLGLAALSSIPQWIRSPNALLTAIDRRRNDALKLGLFAGAFTGLFNLTSCGLRNLTWQDETWHVMVSALVAGQTFRLWPSERVAVYVFWKAVEASYLFGVDAGKLPSYSQAPKLLFSTLCGMLLCGGLLKPHYIRKSYLRFIDKIVGNRIHLLNWSVLDELGYGTTKMIHEQLPSLLSPKHLTPRYLERYWVWSIAGYDKM